MSIIHCWTMEFFMETGILKETYKGRGDVLLYQHQIQSYDCQRDPQWQKQMLCNQLRHRSINDLKIILFEGETPFTLHK